MCQFLYVWPTSRPSLTAIFHAVIMNSIASNHNESGLTMTHCGEKNINSRKFKLNGHLNHFWRCSVWEYKPFEKTLLKQRILIQFFPPPFFFFSLIWLIAKPLKLQKPRQLFACIIQTDHNCHTIGNWADLEKKTTKLLPPHFCCLIKQLQQNGAILGVEKHCTQRMLQMVSNRLCHAGDIHQIVFLGSL